MLRDKVNSEAYYVLVNSMFLEDGILTSFWFHASRLGTFRIHVNHVFFYGINYEKYGKWSRKKVKLVEKIIFPSNYLVK